MGYEHLTEENELARRPTDACPARLVLYGQPEELSKVLQCDVRREICHRRMSFCQRSSQELM